MRTTFYCFSKIGRKYSKTCLGRPPMGRTKCGLSRQVVSEARESRLLKLFLIFYSLYSLKQFIHAQRQSKNFIQLKVKNMQEYHSLKISV